MFTPGEGEKSHRVTSNNLRPVKPARAPSVLTIREAIQSVLSVKFAQLNETIFSQFDEIRDSFRLHRQLLLLPMFWQLALQMRRLTRYALFPIKSEFHQFHISTALNSLLSKVLAQQGFQENTGLHSINRKTPWKIDFKIAGQNFGKE